MNTSRFCLFIINNSQSGRVFVEWRHPYKENSFAIANKKTD